MNPTTANTLGIICAATVCALSATVILQRDLQREPIRYATREVILLPMIHPVIKSSPVDKTKLFKPKSERERLKMIASIWHVRGKKSETRIFADRGK